MLVDTLRISSTNKMMKSPCFFCGNKILEGGEYDHLTQGRVDTNSYAVYWMPASQDDYPVIYLHTVCANMLGERLQKDVAPLMHKRPEIQIKNQSLFERIFG